MRKAPSKKPRNLPKAKPPRRKRAEGEPKRQPGRPSKFNQDVAEGIVLSLRAGVYVETAAAMAGISKVTLYEWLKRGARSDGTTDLEYRAFLSTVETAMAEAEVRDWNDIGVLGRGREAEYDKESGALLRRPTAPCWQALAWRLERRFPERYGRRVEATLKGDQDSPVRVDLTDDERRLRVKELLERGRGRKVRGELPPPRTEEQAE